MVKLFSGLRILVGKKVNLLIENALDVFAFAFIIQQLNFEMEKICPLPLSPV